MPQVEVTPMVRAVEAFKLALVEVEIEGATPAELADALLVVALEAAAAIAPPAAIARVLIAMAAKIGDGQTNPNAPPAHDDPLVGDVQATLDAASVLLAEKGHDMARVRIAALGYVAAWFKTAEGPVVGAQRLYAFADALAVAKPPTAH